MQKVEIVKKHILSMTELKAKKAPYAKKKDTPEYQEKLRLWEKEEKRKSALRQLKLFANGDLIGGSPNRAVFYSGIENKIGEDVMLLDSGEEFPPFQRVFGSLPKPSQSVIFDAESLQRMVEPLSKESELVHIKFCSDEIQFKVGGNHKFFESATLKVMPTDVSKPISFAVNAFYLIELLKLTKRLKIKKLQLDYGSEFRPLKFSGVEDPDFSYILMPIRTN